MKPTPNSLAHEIGATIILFLGVQCIGQALWLIDASRHSAGF